MEQIKEQKLALFIIQNKTMKAATLITLRNALQYQLSYRKDEQEKSFLRDIPHFKMQYALRKNMDKLDKEADVIVQSVANLKTEEKRQKAINEAPEIKIDFYKIKFEEIPNDAKIDASGMWILEHFLETEKV
jgi:hypothetical protein